MAERRRNVVIVLGEYDTGDKKIPVVQLLVQLRKNVLLTCQYRGNVRKRLTKNIIGRLKFYRSEHYGKVADWISGNYVDGSAARIRRIYTVKKGIRFS